MQCLEHNFFFFLSHIKTAKYINPYSSNQLLIIEGGENGKKVLVVDDEFSDLETIKTVLLKEGYDVETATNGAQALDILRNIKPDLCLIDIRMPTLSGYDLLRILRERLNHKVKMVYVSIVPKQDVDMSDIDGFIQKPFSPESLISTVKKVMKRLK